MDLGLNGHVAIVTGASKGIGLAITQALVEEGVSVVAGARRSSDDLEALAATGSVRVLEVDLADPIGPSRLVEFAGKRIDILVNNVGSAPARTDGFLQVTDDQWLHTLGLNLMPAVRAARSVLPLMLAAGHGSIVTISSVNANLPDPGVIDYGAAKAALANFSKALSKEVGDKGIRVNTVSPGPVGTALWLGSGGVAETIAAATGLSPQQVAEDAAHGSMTGRFSRPSEIAHAVLLLASDRSANITGADIAVDGGLNPTL
jgi:NAD(P)-dependent dehydrogenase (short-subunit alcohol dehydrogenase family)